MARKKKLMKRIEVDEKFRTTQKNIHSLTKICVANSGWYRKRVYVCVCVCVLDREDKSVREGEIEEKWKRPNKKREKGGNNMERRERNCDF